MFRRNWVRTTGRVLDSRILRVHHSHSNGHMTGPSFVQHSYVVEFQAPGGETVRLEVEQRFGTIDLRLGGEAPLRVSPDGKKAILDEKDPRINVLAVNKAQEEADAERFRNLLDE